MGKIAIIGGGAAGMTAAVMLARKGKDVTLFERGERLGRKLSATGNGQGNVTNLNMGAEHYFRTIGKRSPARSRASAAKIPCVFCKAWAEFFSPTDGDGCIPQAVRLPQ